MTGPEHYREAERLLVHTELSVADQYGDGAECARQQIAAAQVYATLALAAANAMLEPVKAWGEVCGVVPPESAVEPAGVGG